MRYGLAVMGPDGMLPAVLSGGCRTLLMVDEPNPDNLGRVVRCGAHGALTRQSGAEEVVKAIERTHAGELWFGREAANIALSALRTVHQRQEPRRDTSLGRLTPRERKVLDAVIDSRARPNKSLAKQLFISESTLRNHLSNIYQKLGVSNRLDLLMFAQDCGYARESVGVAA
jgi:DNA-binding NarL/FixJ family response regulator